jgi:hypothetical protein
MTRPRLQVIDGGLRPDPDAAAWRAAAAGLRDQISAEIARTFAWIDAELTAGRDAGAAAIVMAEADLDQGRPLADVARDLLAWMPPAR